jgi:hypothetical protein
MSAHQAHHALGKSALNLQIFCRCFSLVRNFLVFDNLLLIETAEAGSPDSRDIGRSAWRFHIARVIPSREPQFMLALPLHDRNGADRIRR